MASTSQNTESQSGCQDDQKHSEKCFLDWMKLQEVEVSELFQALTIAESYSDHQNLFTELLEKSIKCFQEYIDKRARLAQNDVSIYFAPSWTSSLENSMLWLAGCRPSIFIRLLYALCGSEIVKQISESNTPEFFQSMITGRIGEISAQQMKMINDLHCKIIKDEEKLSTHMASLQEDIADDPISRIAKEQSTHCLESFEEVDKALDSNCESMFRVLREADNLRLNTFKELVSILTPVQAVDYLAAAKKLRLCIHAWGKRRDLDHGRTNQQALVQDI